MRAGYSNTSHLVALQPLRSAFLVGASLLAPIASLLAQIASLLAQMTSGCASP
tara:strand:- start:229 stop:387 length:159 start_codon:yes stop_codon:yes gene_type:complete